MIRSIAFAAVVVASSSVLRADPVTLVPVGTHATGIFDGSAAEIPAYDPVSKKVFVTNSAGNRLTVIDIRNPADPKEKQPISLDGLGDGPTSVAVSDGVVAVAIAADPETDPGKVAFFRARNSQFLGAVTVGVLPDMLTFTPDGNRILTADEGQPSDDYSIDPEGSVSIIDVSGGVAGATVTSAGFGDFNGMLDELREAGVRIFGPGATVAQDLEPEYIAISEDSSTAWVALQENNAFAVVDIAAGEVTGIIPLGFKNHLHPANALDASNRDDGISIRNWPVLGMFQPDGLAAMTYGGQTFILSANEGDARDYDAFSEETRIEDMSLIPSLINNFPTLQEDEGAGRLRATTSPPFGPLPNTEMYNKEIYSFGARSFSIWSADGELVYDSGDDFEQITAVALPDDFNSNNDENQSFDSRSDDKGPEPETVVLGTVGGATYAFIALERIGGIMVYDVSNPFAPFFVHYVNNRDFSVDIENDGAALAGDLAPEGLKFVSADDSPNGTPLLIVANEVSGTTTIYEVREE